MLSQYWSNKWAEKVIENEIKSGKMNHMRTEDAIVRNDEVVGSIPTSSTKLLNSAAHFLNLRRRILADRPHSQSAIPDSHVP